MPLNRNNEVTRSRFRNGVSLLSLTTSSFPRPRVSNHSGLIIASRVFSVRWNVLLDSRHAQTDRSCSNYSKETTIASLSRMIHSLGYKTSTFRRTVKSRALGGTIIHIQMKKITCVTEKVTYVIRNLSLILKNREFRNDLI